MRLWGSPGAPEAQAPRRALWQRELFRPGLETSYLAGPKSRFAPERPQAVLRPGSKQKLQPPTRSRSSRCLPPRARLARHLMSTSPRRCSEHDTSRFQRVARRASLAQRRPDVPVRHTRIAARIARAPFITLLPAAMPGRQPWWFAVAPPAPRISTSRHFMTHPHRHMKLSLISALFQSLTGFCYSKFLTHRRPILTNDLGFSHRISPPLGKEDNLQLSRGCRFAPLAR